MHRLGAIILAISIVAASTCGVLTGATLSLAQSAGTPEALQAARELNAMISKDMLKQMTTQITAQLWPVIERSLRAKRSDVTAEQLAELRAEFERIQFENTSSLMDEAPIIYARYFTAAELREMVAFYHSPLGQKWLRLTPQIAGETMALLTPRIQQVQTKTMEAFTKILKQRGFSI